MATDDRRATLEAIAYGNDPELRPADRLKALELLMLAGEDPTPPNLRAQLAAMSEAELDAELRSFGIGPMSPEPSPMEESEIQRRARLMADEMVRRRALVEPSQLERLVEERAEQRVAALYPERHGFEVIEGSGEPSGAVESPPVAFAEPDSTEDSDPSSGTATAPKPEAGGPPPGIELERGWPRRRPGSLALRRV